MFDPRYGRYPIEICSVKDMDRWPTLPEFIRTLNMLYERKWPRLIADLFTWNRTCQKSGFWMEACGFTWEEFVGSEADLILSNYIKTRWDGGEVDIKELL